MQYKNLKEICFQQDSELESIEEDTFYETMIKNIIIPSKIRKIDKGWNYKMNSLPKITVMKDNTYFTSYEDKYILSKSTPEKENFDVLVSSAIDIKTATIPNYIDTIDPNAFYQCKKPNQVDFQPDLNFS